MPKKHIENFIEERKQVLNKLLNILEINENNNKFSQTMLDEDIEKQKEIIDLEQNIKNFFRYSKWNYFNKKTACSIKRNYISLIKGLIKDMGIQMTSFRVIKLIDNKSKSERFFILNL